MLSFIASLMLTMTGSDGPPLPPVAIGSTGSSPPPIHRIAPAGETALDPARDTAARTAMHRGLQWLRTQADERGGWLRDLRTSPTGEATTSLTPVGAAVSAMGLKAFLQAHIQPNSDVMVRALVSQLMTLQLPDGRFDEGNLSNYVTATIVAALAAVPDDDRAALAAHNGAAALRDLQWDQAESIEPTSDWYGGAGYGNRGRPDLSNTQWMLEALHAAGDCSGSKDAIGCDCDNDPNLRKAVAFLTRCQNSSANAAAWAGDDGGFVYTPANNGESLASERAGDGRWAEHMPPDARSLRSYGSMTYAGYKSMLFAGLSPEDPRVQAAHAWIRSHWGLDSNPGLGRQGWFYYLHALARAMQAGGHAVIIDDNGTPHDWRAELVDVLVAHQQDDGHWTNAESRWLEGHSELATIYALLALQEALKPARGDALPSQP